MKKYTQREEILFVDSLNFERKVSCPSIFMVREVSRIEIYEAINAQYGTNYNYEGFNSESLSASIFLVKGIKKAFSPSSVTVLDKSIE